MPHFFRDPTGKMTNVLQLEHHELVGEGSLKGTCVELAKHFAAGLEGRSTKTWEAGDRVIDLSAILPGVAIATFIEKDGKLVFPGWNSGNHFAFVVRVSGKQNGKIQELVVMDQFQHNDGLARGNYVTTRRIPIQPTTKYTKEGNINMSNDLRYFYIIR
jgi:hypothetical protein